MKYVGNTGLTPFWASHFVRQIKITLRSGFAIKNIIRKPNEHQVAQHFRKRNVPPFGKSETPFLKI
jgi:hypothetical protein